MKVLYVLPVTVAVTVLTMILLFKNLSDNVDRAINSRSKYVFDVNETVDSVASNVGDNIQLSSTWAFATIVVGSERPGYVLMACQLGMQLSEYYQHIPRYAVVGENQINSVQISFLEKAGFQILLRKLIYPAYGGTVQNIYKDQFMKFWLWNETSFSRIVYLDADTYLNNAVDFEPMLISQSLVACPVSWSKIVDSKPITFNGGFFVLTPSREVFEKLLLSTMVPEHFKNHYDSGVSWFDFTEMGTFMRDFEQFETPYNLSDVCADYYICCEGTLHCQTSLYARIIPSLVHGLKPAAFETNVGIEHFDQVKGIFSTWGYNPSCMLEHFVPRYSHLLLKARSNLNWTD